MNIEEILRHVVTLTTNADIVDDFKTKQSQALMEFYNEIKAASSSDKLEFVMGVITACSAAVLRSAIDLPQAEQYAEHWIIQSAKAMRDIMEDVERRSREIRESN